jgi:hypothetical protein
MILSIGKKQLQTALNMPFEAWYIFCMKEIVSGGGKK